MHTVYVTYSGYNCEAVLQVMETLVRMGYGIMCECMLPYCADTEEQAHRHIRQADAVVAVITEDAADCSYMARDLAWAMEANAKILPVVVGDAVLPTGLTCECTISDFPTVEEINAFAERLHLLMEA